MASVGFWLLASKLAWLDAGAVASLAVVVKERPVSIARGGRLWLGYDARRSGCTVLQVGGAQPSGKGATAFANTAVEISAAAPPCSFDA